MRLEDLGNHTVIRTGSLDANAEVHGGKYPFFTCSREPKQIDRFAFDGEFVVVAGNGDLNVKYFNGKFNAYQRTYAISPKDTVHGKYLYYFLEKYIVKLRELSIGGVIKYIKIGNLTEAKIPLPPLPQQQKIANILDAADALRQNDKALIVKYDELANTVFLNMFGDPFFNTQNFIVDNLENLCLLITKGTTPKGVDLYDKFNFGLVPFLKVYHINNENEIDFSYKPSFVSLNTHENLLKRSIVYPNDVLMNIVGPPLGKIALITNVLGECNINQAIAFFRCKEKLNPVYLLHCLSNKNFMTNIIDQAIGVRQQNISLKQCREIKIPVPPIDIQNQFAERVRIIKEQKAIAQKSLEKSESLFNSLLQKAFMGELTNL